MDTCRSLQSLLASPAPIIAQPRAMPSLASLPTPPMAHAPSPMKLRLRQRPTANTTQIKDGEAPLPPRRKITKRTYRPVPRTPTRGPNKRRRSMDDDMGREDETSQEDIASEPETESPCFAPGESTAPSTPKRSRIAPEQMPLGLERSDFHEVERLNGRDPEDFVKPGTDINVEANGEEWSAEDDRVLVELVLEKLNLTKKEWQECARNLGRDRQSVNKRWKSLITHGDVGLKTRNGSRAKLHSTWR